MKSLSNLLYGSMVALFLVGGCATFEETAKEYPVLTHIVLSNAVSQRIKHASNPSEKAAQYMAGVSHLRGSADKQKVAFSTLGEFVRTKLDYKNMVPADRKAIDDLLLLTKIILEKELKRRGFNSIPYDYIVDLGVYLDAVEAGARVYLPQ